VLGRYAGLVLFGHEVFGFLEQNRPRCRGIAAVPGV